MANEELEKILQNQKQANETSQKQTRGFFSGILKKFSNTSDVIKNDVKKAGDEVGKQVAEVAGKEMSATASAISNIIKGDMDKVVGEVASQTSDVLGPELTKVSSVAIGSLKSTVGIGKALFGKGEDDEEESKTDKNRNTMLGQIVDHFKMEQKRWDLQSDKGFKDDGVFKYLLFTGALLSGIIVGYISKFKDVFPPFFKSMTKFNKVFGKTLTKFNKSFGKILIKFRTGVGTKLGKITSMFGGNGIIGSKIFKMQEAFHGWKFDRITELRGKLNKFKARSIGKSLTKFTKTVSGTFSKAGNLMKGKFVESTMKFITKFTGIFGKMGKFFSVGKIIGKVLLPVEMIVKAVTGIFQGDTIRDKLLGMSAGLLDPILAIPEMIGNGLLWLSRKVFGEDFLKGVKLDFGMEHIIEKINLVTEKAESFIHGILDVFFHPIDSLKTGLDGIKTMWEDFSFLDLIKDATENLINFFTDLIPGKEMFGKLKGMFGFGGKVKKEGELEVTEIPSRRIGGDIVKTGLVNLHRGERVLPADVVDLPQSVKRKSDFTEINKMKKVVIQSSIIDKKNVSDMNRKIQEKQLKAMEKTEIMTQEGNVSVVTAISNIQGGGDSERPIPDEVDNIITSLAVQGAY